MDIVEREHELRALTAMADRAREGAGQLVLVSGEAGLGKTSLVTALLGAQPARIRLGRGQCEPPGLARIDGPLQEIAHGLGGALPSVLEKGAGASDFQVVLTELRRLAPAIIVIEDAHWADQSTLDFIRFLGRRIEPVAVLAVVTFRDDEVGPAHPLRRTLGALATSGAVTRVDLAPLSLAAVEQLAADGPHAAEAVHALTGGNPFFVREVLSAAPASGTPRAVRDLVADRLGRLGPSAKALTQLVAVAGRAPSRLLTRLSDTVDPDAEAAQDAGLLVWSEGQATLRHELARLAVLGTLSPAQTQAAHARLLSALEQLGDADAAQLAHHALGAADGPAILRHAPDAARQAAKLGAHRQAVDLYEGALRTPGGLRGTERADLLEAFARACASIDQQPRAILALREAHTLHVAAGETRKAGACLGALALPFVRSGLNAEAEDSCRRAIAELEPWGDTPELAATLRIRAHLRMLDRDKGQALSFGRRALAMARAVSDEAILATAHMTVGTAMLVDDDMRGRHHLRHALRLARALGRHDLLSITYTNAASAFGEQFRLADAARVLADGLAVAEAQDLDLDANYLHAWKALLHLYAGRLEEAARVARRLLQTPDLASISRIMALVALGRASARLGDGASAAALDEALALAETTATLQRLAPVRLARAEAAWLAGDAPAAGREAETVWSLAVRHRHKWYAGESLHWRRAGGAADEIPPWIASPYALQAEGRWREAAAAWEALGCPYEQARALAAGDLEARHAALALFDGLGAAPAAAILRRDLRQSGVLRVPRGPRPKTRENAWGLTGRQQEIARLIAEERSNGEIAEALRISLKTVETHVSAILGKLQVDSRHEARERLSATP
jgi:DNA-binding CsgD family transcriptional regulator/tetratricopeptide (TPR) repeat protein